MRISTGQMYEAGTLGILRNQADLFKTQNQLSTGRRVLTPADDPVAAAQSLVTRQAKEVNARFIENQGAARDQLSMTATQLTAARNALQEVLSRAVQAGNTSLNDANRQSIAKDLQVRLDELISTANAQDGIGRYIFAGFKTSTEPFALTGNAAGAVTPPGPSYPFDGTNRYVGYNGDAGERELQVDASRTMQVAENGYEVFMRIRDRNGNLVDRSVFDTVKNLIDVLNTPVTGNAAMQNALPTNISASLNDINAALDNILSAEASVGARLAELDALKSGSEERNLQYEQTISDMEDLDWASAITRLQQQQVTLQAAQQSFSRVSNLSLFNVI